jgi:hypothetical protein
MNRRTFPFLHSSRVSSLLGSLRRVSVLVIAIQAAALAEVPREIGTRLEMFIDDYLIDRLHGTRLALNEPHPAGEALRFDSPWDGACSGFATILHDNGRYRMYYVGLPMNDTDEEGGSYVCLAESTDGVHWIKPSLGLVEFQGSKNNNILFLPNREEPYAINFAPFLDQRPGVPADERYKAVGGTWRGGGMFVLASSDGVHWRKWREKPVFSNGAFDSQNIVFWSELEQRYVFFYRVFSAVDDYLGLTKWSSIGGLRTIAKTTSTDLVNWTQPQRMSFGDTPLEQFYTNHTHPYFRAPHLYVGMPMRFVPGRRFLTDEQLLALKVVPAYLNIKGGSISHNIPNEVSDTVLLSSRGGYRYDRTFMEALVRPGTEEGNWVSRNGIAVTGIIQTGPKEMSFFVAQHYAQPTAYVKRFAVRLDGLASVHAPYAGGEMLTKPLIVGGRDLILNYSTSAAGEIRVELQEPDGEPIPGYSLLEGAPIVGDSIAQSVAWQLKADLSALVGKPVRIRFVMKDADLYSLRFRD